MCITISEEKSAIIVEEPYLLERDATESQRLTDQHRVLLNASGGYLPIPLSLPLHQVSAVLDIGTGNAEWLLGLRESGLISEEVELFGIDISDHMMPDLELEQRFGLRLEIRDLCEPLPSHWNGKFDLIHGRHVLIWIEPYKWSRVIWNLKQALKPGGTLLVRLNSGL